MFPCPSLAPAAAKLFPPYSLACRMVRLVMVRGAAFRRYKDPPLVRQDLGRERVCSPTVEIRTRWSQTMEIWPGEGWGPQEDWQGYQRYYGEGRSCRWHRPASSPLRQRALAEQSLRLHSFGDQRQCLQVRKE